MSFKHHHQMAKDQMAQQPKAKDREPCISANRHESREKLQDLVLGEAVRKVILPPINGGNN
jgi:type III secretory pathway component EscU